MTRLASLLLLTTSLLAGLDYVVPGSVNRTMESGAHFATELRVRNEETSAAILRFRFLPVGEAPAPEPVERNLLAGQTLHFANVVRELWGLDEVAGVISLESDRGLTVRARRYSDTLEPSVGLELAAIPRTEWVAAGHYGELTWLSRTAARAGSVWVYRDSSAAQAILVLFDQAGKEIGRRELTGAAQAQLISLSEVLPGEADIVRGQLQVLSGNATAFAEVTNWNNQDSFGAAAQRLQWEAPQQVLSPAVRWTGPDGVRLRTDLRLANPFAAPVDVQISYGGVTKRVTLAAGETREWIDILGGLFEQTEDQQGTLLVAAGRALPAMGRLSVWVTSDAPEPLWGSHRLEPLDALLSEPELGRNLGGDEQWAALWLATRSRLGAVEAQFEELDADGNVARQAAETLSLQGNQSRLDSVADLFAGAPGAGAFSFLPRRGSSSAKLIGLRRGSYDPAVLDFAVPEPDVCATPSVVRFWSNLSTLAAPGRVRLEWEVEGAVRIDIAPGLENLPAKGSRELSLAAATDFALRATNACGREDARLSIAVGTPLLQSVARGSGTGAAAEGSPGQLMVLRFDNLTEVENVDYLTLRAADGAEKALTITARRNGTVMALVPYWFADGGSRAYRTGPVEVSARMLDGARTATRTFTITPLVTVSDPVAAFRAFLDSRAAYIRSATMATRTGGDAALAAVMETSAARYEGELRALLADLAAGRDGSLRYTASTPANSITVTVTRQDIADLLAYNDNANAANFALDPAEAAKTASQFAPAAGTCISQSPLGVQIQYCKNLERSEKFQNGLMGGIQDFFDAHNVPQDAVDKGESWVKARIASWRIFVALKKFRGWLTIPNLKCLVDPIRLEKFLASPKLIRYARVKDQGTRVRISAFMRPEKTKDEVKKLFRDLESTAIRKQMKDKKVSKDQIEAIIRFFEDLTNFDLEAEVAKLLEQIKVLQPSTTVQVGDCDLFLVFPQKNGPGMPSNRNAGYVPGKSLLRFSDQTQGEDDYFLMGRRPGPEKLCIQPRYLNFLFHSALEQRLGSLTALCQFGISVDSRRSALEKAIVYNSQEATPTFSSGMHVGEGQPEATLSSDNVEAGEDVTFSQGFQAVPSVVDEGFRRSQDDGFASAKASFVRTGQYSWSLEMEVTGFREQIAPGRYRPHYGFASITVMFENPPNASNTQKARVTGTLTGSPICVQSMGLSAGGPTVGGRSGSASIELVGSSRAQISANLSSGIGNPGETITCKFSGTVELTR